MKSFRVRILERVLRLFARAILWRHRPIVIGITGSVGKSSAKEAIAAVLGSKFRIRSSAGNQNNEIGAPLAVIGAEAGGGSIFRWLLVPIRFLIAFLGPRSRYPEILVLELGIDRIGDMDYLVSFLKPSIGVLTTIGSSHLEFFKTVSTVGREKGKLIQSLPKNGCAVLNIDDERVSKFCEKTKAKVFSFGFREGATVRATHISFFRDAFGAPIGSSFKLEYEGKSIPVRLPHILAEHHISAALAAASVGLFLRMNALEVASALGNFRSLPGRMRLFEGVRRSLIIDDTYNSSPKSLEAAFRTLGSLGGTRRLVALGDMLELGSESDAAHDEVARWIRECRVDEVFFLGTRMARAARSLKASEFPSDRIHSFSDPESLGEFLAVSLREGDIVLIKGSQGMRLEKAVETVMAEPSRARELLCRQSDEWRAKPFVS